MIPNKIVFASKINEKDFQRISESLRSVQPLTKNITVFITPQRHQCKSILNKEALAYSQCL